MSSTRHGIFAAKIQRDPGNKIILLALSTDVDLTPRNVYDVSAVGRILTNFLVVLSLLFGVAPMSVVVVHELSERSTDPETPLEREEAAARLGVSRAASKSGGKHRAADLPGKMTIIAAAQSVASQTLAFPLSAVSPLPLHTLYGVLRI